MNCSNKMLLMHWCISINKSSHNNTSVTGAATNNYFLLFINLLTIFIIFMIYLIFCPLEIHPCDFKTFLCDEWERWDNMSEYWERLCLFIKFYFLFWDVFSYPLYHHHFLDLSICFLVQKMSENGEKYRSPSPKVPRRRLQTVLFCQQPKDTQFAVIEDKSNQNIWT